MVCGHPATIQKVYLNDGAGSFGLHQAIGSWYGQRLGLADLNGDARLDAVVTARSTGNVVLINEGTGTFLDSGQRQGDVLAEAVGLGDLRGTRVLDAFVGSAFYHPSRVWFQDRKATSRRP